ncbi:MAG: replication initiation protein [Cetobacterium sp.]
MTKIVEYDSKMNKLSFGKFKEKELDIFFSICYKMKNQGTTEVLLTFQELKELSSYQNRNLERFIDDLKNTYKKLLNITLEIETEKKTVGFVLFTWYEMDKENRNITISVNEKYKFILNDLTKFTKFDLLEFVSLKSSYAKNMFKVLKQFDKLNYTNWYIIQLDEFKRILDIPSSYKMYDIDKRVLAPILVQLEPYFKNLEVTKIKKGVKVNSLKFTWKSKEKKTSIKLIKKKKSLGETDLLLHELEQISNKESKICNDIPKEEIIKIKITLEDYEALYISYLDRIEEKDNIFIRKSFDINNKNKYEII